ncbi:TetR family transcriptional regulator [Lentzea sp.]|uniref:TetR family transcriptional regulator n=1 Tax=Lentzea sp. TaxID=56099 RepID=UPI002ED461DA
MSVGKREQILRAAVDLAKAQGLAALSVRAVAAAAGVGATTLRNYFPSQTALHQAVAAELVTVTLEDGDIADASRPPAERLADRLDQFLPLPGQVETSLQGWLEYYRLSFGPEASTATAELLHSGRRASAEVLTRWLGVLAAEGRVAEDAVDDHVTRLLVVVDGIHLTMLTDPDRLDLDGAKRLLREHAKTLLSPQA